MPFKHVAFSGNCCMAGLELWDDTNLIFDLVQIRRMVSFYLEACLFDMLDPLLAALAGAAFVNIQ